MSADERLLWLLRRAGDEWGPAGVAKVAAGLAEQPKPPLYVNHPRDYCVEGDVARDADDDSPPTVWLCANPDEGYDWWYCPGEGFHHRDAAPERLRLLVDGETGQVVPS